MSQRIVRIAVHPTSLVLALATAAVSAIFVLVPLLVLVPAGRARPAAGLILITPVIYFAATYVACALWIWVFNHIAPRLGGIVLTLSGGSGDRADGGIGAG